MKYALVTGASRGIGRAISVGLAKMGYHILINYNESHTGAEETLFAIRQAGFNGELLRFDVSDCEVVKAVLDRWNEEHNGEYIEVLVNNAGIRKDNLMVWMPYQDWNSIIKTNLEGFFNVTQPLLQNMIVKKYGRIINVVSLSGIKGMKGQVNYSAAKGGLVAATKSLALELAGKKITVNAVAPGFIRSDMTKDLDEKELKGLIPAGRFGEAGEVASLVSFLASGEASYITGEVISINGGLYT